MAETKREIERKYEIPGEGGLPELSRVSEVSRVVDKGLVALDAVYYDTPDLRLAADAITLRRRTGGADAGWHLKLPVSLAEGVRDEIHVPFDAAPGGGDTGRAEADAAAEGEGDAAAEDAVGAEGPAQVGEAAEAPPEALAALVRSRVRDMPLTPVVRLRSARRLSHLLDAGGDLLAEVSVDRVHARWLGGHDQGASGRGTDAAGQGRPAGQPEDDAGGDPARHAGPSAGDGPSSGDRPSGGDGHGARTTEWTEAEVELAEGRPMTFLDTVEEHLRTAGWRPARAASKLARALTETAPDALRTHLQAAPQAAPQAALRADTPIAAGHVLAYLRTQRTAIVDLDPAARRDLPDAVHQMRVATRRARSAMRSYRKVLDRSSTAPLGTELKWLAAELGVGRDQEVLAEQLSAGLDGLPPDLRMGPVRERMDSWSSDRRGGSQEQLIAALDSERYLTLLGALDDLLADPPLRSGASATKPKKVLAKAVQRDHRRLSAQLDEALRKPPGSERDTALHEARKSAKRLRYAAEAARPALGARAKRTVSWAKRLQTLLGDHQDSVMARGALRELAEQAQSAGENGFTYGVLYGREEQRAAEDEAALVALPDHP